MNSQWYSKKWVTVSLHILFWTVFFVMPYLLQPVFDHEHRPEVVRNALGFYLLHFLNNLLRMLLFYANAYILIPRLVYRKQYSLYIISLIGAFLLIFLGDKLFFTSLITGMNYKFWNFFVFNILPFLFIVASSAAYRMIRDRIKENQINKERETENLKTELSFLRSQVSPHFMFNVLNNMVALARKKSDDLEPSLIKLSSLLRYMLYETNEDKVLLEKEIEYLKSYIDLQRQRFGKNVSIQTNFSEIEPGHTIEPMLLIPFVENAFKHGTGMILNAEIHIDMKVQNGRLYFKVANKYADLPEQQKDKTSGIGLTNAKRRLNLLYDNSHSLQVDKRDGWFKIDLQIKLHQ
ncbi:MAG TPA: histidine kinase [Lacibacter sp.]|nr:histidine kinase [Lacibacter sp.]